MIPAFLKRRVLGELFALTARGFELEAPGLRGLSYAETLEAYARFTSREAARALAGGMGEAVRRSLLGLARERGAGLRRLLRIRSMEKAMVLARLGYDLLGIDFSADGQGGVCMAGCFFKDYYSPEICRLMSALDEGLLCGLCGRDELRFSRRLTEGGASCLARLA